MFHRNYFAVVTYERISDFADFQRFSRHCSQTGREISGLLPIIYYAAFYQRKIRVTQEGAKNASALL